MTNFNATVVKNLDFSYVEDVAGGKKEIFHNLLKLIAKSLKDYPPRLNATLLVEDYQLLRQTAHKYKSSVTYLGHQDLNQSLDQLELSDKSQISPAQIAQLVAKVACLSADILDEVHHRLKY